MTLQEKLAAIQSRCQATAKDMANLELSIWDAGHESELKSKFGFNSNSLKERKLQLKKQAIDAPGQ